MSHKLSTSSLGLHNKSSHRQSRHNLTTRWIATQGSQASTSELGHGPSEASHEILAPAITLTQPDESNSEVPEVLLPQIKVEAGSSHCGERKPESSDLAESTGEPPRKKCGWQGSFYPSALNLVDEPIPEEEEVEVEEEEEKDEEEKTGEEEEAEEGENMDVTQVVKNRSYIIDKPVAPSLASPRSPGGSLRCARAKSFPVPQYMHSQQMLELPTAGKEAQKETTAVAVEPKKDQQHLSPMFKFAQVAVMAKKWKLRSRDKTEDSHQSSRELLFNRQKKRPFVEVPHPLRLEILEEAHQIVTKTLQMYRSELGLRHKLTQQAEQHCETLAQQLGQSAP